MSRDRAVNGRPADPLVILRDLPGRSSSASTTGRSMLRTIRPIANGCGISSTCGVSRVAAARLEELATARAGTATTLPITDAILDWAERATTRGGSDLPG